MPAATKILLISGSLRSGSVNTAVLQSGAHDGAGIDASRYEGMGELPHFNPDDDPDGGLLDPRVADLRARLADADAVPLCTPEYAGAMPACRRIVVPRDAVGPDGRIEDPAIRAEIAGALHALADHCRSLA